MVLKTERFEMRFDPVTLAQLDAWRARQVDVPSRAEAVRRLVDDGLNATRPESFRLSQQERLTTWLLTEILKGQPDRPDKPDINLIQQAIYGGHSWALEWELQGVMHKHEDQRESVSFVVNVLDMWQFIERAFRELSDADKVLVKDALGLVTANPRFIGFDGNNETELMGIAQFLISDMGRFEAFKGRDINSHMPVAARYRRMYQKFEPIRANLIGRELSAKELIYLLNRAPVEDGE